MRHKSGLCLDEAQICKENNFRACMVGTWCTCTFEEVQPLELLLEFGWIPATWRNVVDFTTWETTWFTDFGCSSSCTGSAMIASISAILCAVYFFRCTSCSKEGNNLQHVRKTMGIEKKRESVTHNSFLDRLTESFVLAAVEVLEKINSSRLYIFVFLLSLNYLQRNTNN